VATFVRENKEDLTANISDLASVTGVLVKQRAALEEFLDVSPTALSNLQLAYNPATGTLDTRDNNIQGAEVDPLGAICNALLSANQDATQCLQARELLKLPAPPGGGGSHGAPPANPLGAVTGAATAPGAPGTTSVVPGGQLRDMTLGGILDGGR
jgi:ABC-type transporter Mla subunit MlaD